MATAARERQIGLAAGRRQGEAAAEHARAEADSQVQQVLGAMHHARDEIHGLRHENEVLSRTATQALERHL